MLNKLSVIMPFVNEPWAAFTLQSLILELEREEFPWDIVDVRVKKDELKKSYDMSMESAGISRVKVSGTESPQGRG